MGGMNPLSGASPVVLESLYPILIRLGKAKRRALRLDWVRRSHEAKAQEEH
jgi:hypothetical protein